MFLTMKKTALALSLLGVIGVAQATSLPENSTTTSVDTSTFFGGTLLDSAITNINNLSYNGIARAAVYSTVSGLDFYYQFSSDTSSANAIGRFTGSDFSPLGSSIVDVYQTDQTDGIIFSAGTVLSKTADRGSFGVIGFNFDPQAKLDPGFTSFTQIVRTNATEYTKGTFGLLNGIGDNAVGFAPALAVPEPETYALLLAGLGLMGTIARRRNRA